MDNHAIRSKLSPPKWSRYYCPWRGMALVCLFAIALIDGTAAEMSGTSVPGSAEATTLGDASIDFVTAAQAFHWFERHAARREFRRILKPGGWVVVLWNDRRMEEAPLTREYEGVLERFGIDYQKVKDSYPESADIRSFFDGGVFTARDLPNHQILDWEGFRGRLGSSSFAPTAGHPHYAPMMAELERIFRQHQQDGSVRMEYFTRLYFGQLRADGD